MSATLPDREGSRFDESGIDSDLEHQLRHRNVAHAARDIESGSLGTTNSGEAAGDLTSVASTTTHTVQQSTGVDTEPEIMQVTPPSADDSSPAAAPPDTDNENDTVGHGTGEISVDTHPGSQTEARTEVCVHDLETEGKERSCRICFGGLDEEGEMGRLISPCLCSGSMRYVHVSCLGMWRAKNSKTFLECPQCKYVYRLRRGRIGDLMLSTRMLALGTLAMFLIMSLTAGHFLLHFLLNLYQKGTHSSSVAGSTWESEDGTMVVYMSGATFILDLIDDSINTFIAITGAAFDIFEGSRWVTPLMLDIILRFLLGVSLLGSLSALSLLGSLRLLAPLQLLYTISLSGIVDMSPALSVFGGSCTVIVLFVLVGVANSVIQVYDALHAMALFGLRFVESEIMEPTRDSAGSTDERPRTWYRVWLQERKWRNIDGWQEVWTRARDTYKRARPQNDTGRDVLVQMAAADALQAAPAPATQGPAARASPVVEPVAPIDEAEPVEPLPA